MRKIIIPDNEQHWLDLRKKYLTSTDVPILFNEGYMSYEQLLQNKKTGIVKEMEQNQRMVWGNFLEEGIAKKFANDNKWNIEKMDEFIYDDEIGLASSFDYKIKLDNGEYEILEIKNVSFEQYKNQWLKGFSIEATFYIECQIQVQLMMSGYKKAYIGACIAGNEGVLLVREPNPKVQEAILAKAKEFWRRIDESK